MKIILFYSIQADLVSVSFQTFRFFPHKASVSARGATQNFWNWSWNFKKNKLFEHDDDVSMGAGSRIRQLCRVYIIRTMCFHILAPMTEKIFQALESEIGDMIGDILMLELQIQEVS